MNGNDLRDAARKAAQKINDDLTRQMFGAYTNAPERPEPPLSLDTLYQTISTLQRKRVPSMEIYITEHMQERDKDGPVIMVADNPLMAGFGFSRSFSFGADKRIVMHPQTFLDNMSTMPTDVPIYGYEAVARWAAKKAAELKRLRWPTVPARIPYVFLTAVLLLVMLLVAAG